MAIKSIAPTLGVVTGEWELEKYKVEGDLDPNTMQSQFRVTDTVHPTLLHGIELYPERKNYDGQLNLPIDKETVAYYQDAFSRLEILNHEFCEKYYKMYLKEMKDASDKYRAEHKEEIQAELDRLHQLGDEFRKKYFE